MLQHGGFIDVNAHTDVVGVFGLFVIANDPVVPIEFQDPEVDLDASGVCGDGQCRLLFAVEPDQRVKIEIRQQIAVHHQKRAVQPRHQRQRSGGTGRFLFLNVAQ